MRRVGAAIELGIEPLCLAQQTVRRPGLLHRGGEFDLSLPIASVSNCSPMTCI